MSLKESLKKHTLYIWTTWICNANMQNTETLVNIENNMGTVQYLPVLLHSKTYIIPFYLTTYNIMLIQ